VLDTLVLNADYTPMRIVPWERGVLLVLADRAQLVAPYVGRHVRSARAALPWPAVITLARYERRRPKLAFGRRNVFARDGHACQYCGAKPRNGQNKPDLGRLTLDHVVPRAHAVGGRVTLPWSGATVAVSSWENVVCACAACNHRKGARTPDQAGMRLREIPRAPRPGEGVGWLIARAAIPDEWRAFVDRAA
jgi:5-methylcytosine-specific restriction endonuclease McrA